MSLIQIELSDEDLDLIADALEIVNPDEQEDEDRARELACWFRSKKQDED